jgi:hypothetical protein
MFSEHVLRFGRMIGHSEARLFVGFTQYGSDGGYDVTTYRFRGYD